MTRDRDIKREKMRMIRTKIIRYARQTARAQILGSGTGNQIAEEKCEREQRGERKEGEEETPEVEQR